MRIAYYARWDVSAESGVLKKIAVQIREWRAAGHEAALFVLSRGASPWEPAAAVVQSVVRETGWLTRSIHLARLIRQIDEWRPDVVYARFEAHASPLAKMMRRVPTVLEVNSDDLAEYRIYLPRYQYLHHRATRERTLRHAAGFVAMTHELARRVEKYGRPVAVIANGIDLNDFASLPAIAHGPPRLVFMGAPLSSWHGVDNLVALARVRPGIRVELVGPGHGPGFPHNVTAHGFLPRRSYEAVHARSDAGVGTLGLYRKDMEEACPLKLREYLAMGLPAVIGYRDTDFPRPVPFILEIPNKEGNAVENADAIVAFCEKWRGRRVERPHIRHLDVSLKERERLSFLAQFAG